MNRHDCFLHMLHLFVFYWMSPPFIRSIFSFYVFSDPTYKTSNWKKSLFVLFWDLQRCACGPAVDRKLYKPTMPPSSNTNTQMACLMISILTGCQYILLLLKGLGLNLRIQRSLSLDWLSKLLLSKLVQTWCLTLRSHWWCLSSRS